MEKSHHQGNGKPTCSTSTFAKSNGKTECKQRSFSLSSCESNSDFIKMPILNTSYGSSLSVSNANNVSRTSSKRSAGDVLIDDLKSPSSPTQISRSLKRRCSSSCQENGKEAGDVVDSVPTRSFKPKTLIDHSTLEREQNGDKKLVKPSTSSEDDSLPQNEPAPTCCKVFCTLLPRDCIFTRYNILDLILNIGSIVLYFFDFITDWLNAIAYLFRKDEEDYLFYFYLTVVVIVLPSIVMHAFSVWWEIEDNQHIRKEKRKRNLENKLGCCYFTWVTFSHLFQVAPVYRYMRTIYYGVKSRYKEASGKEDRWKFYDRKYKGELADVNFIRLMESFLEAAPQLVLQIYIMIRTVQTPTITVLSVSVSLVGMAISFVAYQRALRNSLENKEQLTIPASIVLLLFRSLTILSRVLALALLLNTNVWAWIGFFLGHWFLMSFVIAFQKTEFCSTKAKEYVYDAVIGFCYTFAYINVHFGSKNRYRMLAYYLITFVENSAMAVLWLYFRRGGGSIIATIQGIVDDDVTDQPVEEGALSDNIALSLVIAVIALFVLGMLCFLVYYLWLHPKAIGARMCVGGSFDGEIDEEDKMKEVALRPSCGDNYRTHRGAPQFRSWHSASINYPTDTEESKKTKRPLSEVLPKSPSMLYDLANSGSSTVNLLSVDCSCYSMRNEVDNSKSLNSKHPAHGTPPKLPHQRSSTTSYREAILNSGLEKEQRNYFNEADRKRRRVSELLEQKQREKKELEFKQAMLRRSLENKQRQALQVQKNVQQSVATDSVFEVQDLFDRKQRAMHIYSPKSKRIHKMVATTAGSVPMYLQTIQNKPTTASPEAKSSQAQVRMSVGMAPPVEPLPSGILIPVSENHNASNSTHRTRFVAYGGGTFPRCTRNVNRLPGRAGPNSFQRGGSLKPISEVGCTGQLSGVRNSTASLVDLAATRQPNVQTVPRAMSFTISKNEVVESMESSL